MVLKTPDGETETFPMFIARRNGESMNFPDPLHVMTLLLPLIRAMASNDDYKKELARCGITIENVDEPPTTSGTLCH